MEMASQAFGCLSKSTFRNKDVSKFLKGRIYVALILSILLHGCETWFVREEEYHLLRRFHKACVRAMCRVSMSQVRRHRIRTKKLLNLLCSRLSTTLRVGFSDGQAISREWIRIASRGCYSHRGARHPASLDGPACPSAIRSKSLLLN